MEAYKKHLQCVIETSVYTYITFFVFETHHESQQTITGRILRKSNLNDTIHSMLC